LRSCIGERLHRGRRVRVWGWDMGSWARVGCARVGALWRGWREPTGPALWFGEGAGISTHVHAYTPPSQPWGSRPLQTLQSSLLAPSRTNTRVAARYNVPPRHNLWIHLICRLLSSHASKQPLCSNCPSSEYVNCTKCLLAVVHFTSLSPVRHADGVGLGLRSESFT
jgi:hypothetical protein